MKKSFLVPLLLALALLAVWMGRRATVPITRVQWPVMGTIARLAVRGGEAADAQGAVRAVYDRLDDLLSAWDPQSELCRLSAAGRTNWLETASPEVRPCYAAALDLQARSGGAFNPCVGARLRTLGVGNGCYASFDLGAIAKGFAVDRAAAALAASAATPHETLLDLGGNLRACGGEWTMGVRNPFGGAPAAVIVLRDGESAATSGNYERFIEREGVRYSHILDGRTGEHVQGVAGVTVVTPPAYGAILADGLSTTLFVLGPKDGAAWLSRHYPEALALWIPDTPETPHLVATPAMKARLVETTLPVKEP